MAELSAHPRLYISADALSAVATQPQNPTLQAAAHRLATMADSFTASPVFTWKQNTHNAHLIRARRMQTRVVTLITRFYQTGETRYRDAALEHLLEIGNWEYWSWIAWRQDNPDPNAVYDLSYGENNATLALGFDLLHDHLSDEERQSVVEVARRGVNCFVHHTKDRTAGWFGRPTSNWNTVCAGGGGMLALAMYEYLPEADLMLDRAEESFKPFMDELVRTNGGWVEGIGYWNYGMRYAFMYLLSHERATEKKHPLLHRKATKQTLRFPMDFTPHGHGCSFGDVNHWAPLPFHFAAAVATGETHLLPELDYRLDAMIGQHRLWATESWPNIAEMLLLHPDHGGQKALKKAPAKKKSAGSPTKGSDKQPVARIYKGLDWAVLADRERDASLFASIRAGSSDVPHAHLDLSSFHLVANGEHFIQNLGPGEYLDSTFSPRRWDLFEMAPASKNVLLLNGVGFEKPAEVAIRPITMPGATGFRLDMTDAMGRTRDGGAAKFYARVFLLVENKAMLVIDRIVPKAAARLEQRMFTPAEVVARKKGMTLSHHRKKLGVAFAADIETSLHQAQAMMTTPVDPPPTALRHCSSDQVLEATMVTLFTPGDGRPKVTVSTEGRGVVVQIDSKAVQQTVKLTGKLLAAK